MTRSLSYKHYHIHCSLEGTGEKLVFLHGWPTNSTLWNAQIESLSKSYQTIAIDWLGFGKSDKPLENAYTFSQQQEILDTVLSELLAPDEQVTLIAHDIGGPPAIRWTSEHPDRVKRLILLNTVLYPFSTPLDKMSHFLFRIPIIREIIVSAFGLRVLMQTMTRSRGKAVNSRIRALLGATEDAKSAVSLTTILSPLDTGKKHELLSLAETFRDLPVARALIIATGDPLCYAHIKKLHEENPTIPAYFMDKCGHYIPLDRPAELTEILMQILCR